MIPRLRNHCCLFRLSPRYKHTDTLLAAYFPRTPTKFFSIIQHSRPVSCRSFSRDTPTATSNTTSRHLSTGTANTHVTHPKPVIRKMDVHLLVYDLSRGMAKQMSAQLLGFQLDAVYHTSIKLNGREYVYDGNIVSIIPGSSHLGRPLEEMYLGKTECKYHIRDILQSRYADMNCFKYQWK